MNVLRAGGELSDGFAQGARVECDWNSVGIYFPGTVVSRNGDDLEILYDDGDRESTGWKVQGELRC